MRRSRLVAIAVVVASFVFVVHRWGSHRAAPAERDATRAVPSAHRGAPDRDPTISPADPWEPGLDRVGRVELGVAMTGSGGAAPVGMRLGGTWHTTVVDRIDDGSIVRVELAEVTLVSAQAAPLGFEAELSRPWFLEIEDDGRIRAAWFAEDVTRTGRDILKSIAAYLQVCHASDPDACTRIEEDATGTYRASYLHDGAGQHRHKDGYVAVMTPQGAVAPDAAAGPEVRSSQGSLELDASDWPVRATIEETIAASLPQQDQAILMHASVRLEPISAGMRADLVGTFGPARPRLRRVAPLAEAADEAATAQALDRQMVGGATYAQLAEQLRAAPDEHARAALLRRLRALFALDPGAVRDAAATLARGGLSDDAAKTLVAALGASGTPESQRVLLDYLANTRGTDMRQQTLGSLGLTPAPTEATAAALAALVDNPADARDRSTALLALGSVGRTQKQAVARVLEKLQGAHSIDELMLGLRALANTRDPAGLPAITAALASNDPAVRAAAVEALRLIDDTSVDPLIATALRGDADPEVRAAAVFAASFRALDRWLPALTQALREDPEALVRTAVLHLLAAHRLQRPECSALLAWSEANDRDAEVRRLARDLIGQGG